MASTLRDRQFDPPLILDNAEHTVGALAAGDCYRITVHCHAPDHFGKALFVLASGREVGYMRLPYLPDTERVHLAAVFRVPPGDRTETPLTLRPETLPDNLGSSEISIEAIRVERYRPQPASLAQGSDSSMPPTPLIGVWAVVIITYYQRKSGVDPDYLADHDARYYRSLGANLFPHTIYKKVRLDPPVEGVGGAMVYPIAWDDYGIKTDYCFLDDPNWLGKFGEFAGKIKALNGKIGAGVLFPLVDNVETEDKHRVMQAIMEHLSDSLALENDQPYEFIESEFYFKTGEDLHRMSTTLESLCPGACLMDYHLRPAVWPPNYLTMQQSAHGFGQVKVFGMDDHEPIRYSLADGSQIYDPPLYGGFTHIEAMPLEDGYGRRFIMNELDMRDIVAPDDIYGGGCEDDWIIKQVNDMVRPDFLTGSRHVIAPCLYTNHSWSSPDRIVTGAAVSSDPILAALAAQLKTTGKGGVFDRKRQEAGIDSIFEDASSRPRLDYSAETWFLQNNYIRLYISPDSRRVDLWADPQTAAHYDNDSLAVKVFPTLFEIPADWTWRRRETGPALAALEAEKGNGETTMVIEMLPQSPYLQVICSGQQCFNLAPGDQVVVEDDIATCSNARDHIPDRFFLTLGAESERPSITTSGSRVITEGSEQPYRVVIGIRQFLGETKLPALRETIGTPDETEKVSCPVIKVATLSTPPVGPVWVTQDDWWIKRAAQPSKQNTDAFYVKLKTEPGRSPRVDTSEFLFDCIKPGASCDYLLAFKDVVNQADGIEAVIAVLDTNPLVSAPEVAFPTGLEAVWINDEPWSRFYKNRLFLPMPGGQYRLKIALGECPAPQVLRSTADFVDCQWNQNDHQLQLKICHPPWCRKIPGWYHYTALINLNGWELSESTGATVQRSNNEKAIIAFHENEATLHFKNPD